MSSTSKLKTGDLVRVVSGREKGKEGRILRVDRDKQRVVVEGLNLVKKTMRPKGQNQKGGISDIEAALDWAKVMVVCKKCGPSRIGFKLDGTEKTRVCRKCGEPL